MLDKLIKRLEQEGKIKKQMENLLRESILDLKEAKKIVNIDERATYLLAYISMLKADRALLLLKGYIPDDGAQHKTVVELTGAILGDKYRHLTEQFEIMRRKRHEMTYEAGTLLSMSESQRAFSDAISLIEEILKEVKSKNPQLELKLDLNNN